jgi:hypothetical protein
LPAERNVEEYARRWREIIRLACNISIEDVSVLVKAFKITENKTKYIREMIFVIDPNSIDTIYDMTEVMRLTCSIVTSLNAKIAKSLLIKIFNTIPNMYKWMAREAIHKTAW